MTSSSSRGVSGSTMRVPGAPSMNRSMFLPRLAANVSYRAARSVKQYRV
jgi:hypothetical protein